MIGFSSDGDHRLLATMLHQINLRVDWKFVQDPTHIATKIRNRALKTDVVLPLGRKQISFAHLKILIANVPKLIHGLTNTDIDPKDRQNYRSYEKITSERVRNALSEHVVESEGTVKFLEKCHQITSSYMQHDLSPLERLYRIWNAVHFLRIWRFWIKSTRLLSAEEHDVDADAPHYTVDKNFITSNAYNCIEINAMSLIGLVKQFREENAPEKFVPPMFSSQTCEQMFRQFRSMGTANFTKINFTMFELLNMARRVEIKNGIEQCELADVDIFFPRSKRAPKTRVFSLPSDEEIEQALLRAKTHAIDEAKQFGMTVNLEDLNEFQFPASNFTIGDSQTGEDDILPESDIEIEHLSDVSPDEIDESELSDLDEKSSFTLVTNEDGDVVRIRKSTYVWALSAPTRKMSNDRLIRVTAGAQTENDEPRRNPIRSATRMNRNTSESIVETLDVINIGDWCFFKKKNHEQILIGVVLRFQYARRKSTKDKSYTDDSVSLSDVSTRNAIETLCTFYRLGDDGNLNDFPNSHFNINLSNYLATLVGITPQLESGKMFFKPEDFEIVRDKMEQIQ